MTVGDRVVVMDHGRIQRVDTPVVLYARRANPFVAGFVGTPPMNLLDAECADGVLRIGDQRLPVPDALRERLGARPPRLVAGDPPQSFALRGWGLAAPLHPRTPGGLWPERPVPT